MFPWESIRAYVSMRDFGAKQPGAKSLQKVANENYQHTPFRTYKILKNQKEKDRYISSIHSFLVSIAYELSMGRRPSTEQNSQSFA